VTKTEQKKINVKRRKKLLKLWSSEGRKEDQCCYLCGTTDRLQAHHAWSKKMYPALRFDPHNRIIVCCSCHSFKGRSDRGSMHMSPEAVVNWALDNMLQYQYLCDNKGNEINLDDTAELDRIEQCILDDKPLWDQISSSPTDQIS